MDMDVSKTKDAQARLREVKVYSSIKTFINSASFFINIFRLAVDCFTEESKFQVKSISSNHIGKILY